MKVTPFAWNENILCIVIFYIIIFYHLLKKHKHFVYFHCTSFLLTQACKWMFVCSAIYCPWLPTHNPGIAYVMIKYKRRLACKYVLLFECSKINNMRLSWCIDFCVEAPTNKLGVAEDKAKNLKMKSDRTVPVKVQNANSVKWCSMWCRPIGVYK